MKDDDDISHAGLLSQIKVYINEKLEESFDKHLPPINASIRRLEKDKIIRDWVVALIKWVASLGIISWMLSQLDIKWPWGG